MKAKAIYPMPRNSLILLLVAVVLAIIPHVERLPLWLPVVVMVSVLWRIQVYRERIAFPGKLIRFLAVLVSFGAVFVHYGTIAGPDAGVALLILAYSYKLLEMYKERDAFLLVILSYFVVATNYLFYSSLLSSLYTFVVVSVVTAALVSLNQSRTLGRPTRSLKVALAISLQALPVMVVLFIFVPRIAPVWNLDLLGGRAKTGLSDSVTPGDISSLSKSSELAFTVDFSGRKPENKELYWRGVTYTDFDGRTWRRDLREDFYRGTDIAFSDVSAVGEPLTYRVIMEPTQRNWLFALPFANVTSPGSKQTASLVHVSKDTVSSLLSYEVTSHVDYRYQVSGLPAKERARLLALPPTDPRTASKARELLNQVAGNRSVYVERVLDWFNRDSFIYTLNPPTLTVNSIDGFLFGTKQGFCAHYAGAFVFLMRSAGIPARMVGGYQGGEYHEAGHLVVRQYHAHAWAEIWIDSFGWIRVDPTAAVAPERVFSGPEEATTDDSFSLDSPLSPLLLRNAPFLRELRSQLEYMDYVWSKWVVGYNSRTQMAFLSDWVDGVTPQKLVIILLVALGLVMLGLGVYILVEWGREKRDPIDRLYLTFCAKLADNGIERGNGEGVWSFCTRACQAFPQYDVEITHITELYDAIRYGDLSQENNENISSDDATLSNLKNELRQAVKALRLR